jgi:hypothetical protein
MTLRKHERRRAKQREIARQEVCNAVLLGKRLPAEGGRIQCMLDGIIAIIEATEEVVTVYKARGYQVEQFKEGQDALVVADIAHYDYMAVI